MAVPRSPLHDRHEAIPARAIAEDPEDSDGSVTHEDPTHEDEDPSSSKEGRQRVPPTMPPEDLAAELPRARRELQRARQEITVLRRTVTPAPKNLRELKVNKPAEFDGKISEYGTFISQCLLIFSMCPISYAKDEQKVLFVISYLSSAPRGWARSILEDPTHPYRNDFAAFKKALDAMYADRNLKQRALDRLGRFEQLTKSVASYSAEFQHIIAPLKLDDNSKRSMFYKGLHRNIKKALIYFQKAKTFDKLLEQCISIDQKEYALRLEEKEAEKLSKPHSKPPGNFQKPSQPTSPNTASMSKQRQSSQSDSPRGPRGPVSEEEKNRRRKNNLCYRCGSPEHRIGNCHLNKGRVPNYPAKASNMQTPAPEYSGHSLPPENWPSQGTSRPAP